MHPTFLASLRPCTPAPSTPTIKTHVLDGQAPAVYAQMGHLLFARGNSIVAQRFDLNRLELVGDANPLVPQADFASDWYGEPRTLQCR